MLTCHHVNDISLLTLLRVISLLPFGIFNWWNIFVNLQLKMAKTKKHTNGVSMAITLQNNSKRRSQRMELQNQRKKKEFLFMNFHLCSYSKMTKASRNLFLLKVLVHGNGHHIAIFQFILVFILNYQMRRRRRKTYLILELDL